MQPVEQAVQPPLHNSAQHYSPKSKINSCPECGGPKIFKNARCRSCRNRRNHPPERPETFVVDGDVCRWLPLTRGEYAIVLADHYKRLSAFRWHISGNRRGRTLYASAFDDGRRHIKLHHVVAGYSPCDHINGNGLDNRPRNLRPCTDHQNSANAQRSLANKTGYKGVRRSKNGKLFVAILIFHRKAIHLGQREVAADAARLYDAAAVHFFGEYARLNFPEEREQARIRGLVIERPLLSRCNTSGYVGVSFVKKLDRWQATVYRNGKAVPVGYSSDPREAAIMRDKAARREYGSNAKLNFPELVSVE